MEDGGGRKFEKVLTPTTLLGTSATAWRLRPFNFYLAHITCLTAALMRAGRGEFGY